MVITGQEVEASLRSLTGLLPLAYAVESPKSRR